MKLPSTEPQRSASAKDTSRGERLLPAPARFALVAATAGTMVLLYAFALLALLAIGALLLFEVAGIIVIVRFGLAAILVRPATALARVCGAVTRCLFLRREADLALPLSTDDAPGLYRAIEDVAQRVGVAPPDDILLTPDLSAAVHLRGYRKGRGRYKMAVGYDLLAVLTDAEFEAVAAHEMAHVLLTHRSLANWLANGLTRMANMAVALDALNGEFAQAGRSSHAAAWIARAAHFLGQKATRLFAAYSRQDEFAADALAARCCGTEVFRSALIGLYVTGSKAEGLSWRDRIVQTQRGGSFIEWLQSRLVPDAQECAEIEEKLLSSDQRGDFDRHPVLSDRLAALPQVPQRSSPDTPAIGLLSDPDGAAERLISVIESVIAEQERKDSQLLGKRAQGAIGHRKLSAMQVWAAMLILFSVVMLVLLMVAITDSPTPGPNDVLWLVIWFAACAGSILAGVWLWRRFPIRERATLPAPPFSLWKETVQSPLRKSKVDEWAGDVEAELRAGMPASVRRKSARARYWGDVCYQALAKCDYRHAHVASQLCLQAKKDFTEGLIGHGICSAYFGNPGAALASLDKVWRTYNAEGSVAWALGWTAALVEDWETAEVYLLSATASWPDAATIWGLLAGCQWRREKLHEAAANARRAARLAPGDFNLRMMLVCLLLSVGRVKEAVTELDALQPDHGDHPDVMLASVHASLLLGETDLAAERADRLEKTHPPEKTLLGLAYAYADCGMYDQARKYHERRSQFGFCPDALVGLARMEYHAGQYDKAREYLMSALDVTRELPDGERAPIDVLPDVCRALVAMGEPIKGCSAWVAHADMRDSPANVDRLTLLIWAVDRKSALDCVRMIYNAMHPGQDLPESLLTWEAAGRESQPEGPAVPGIYGIGTA